MSEELRPRPLLTARQLSEATGVHIATIYRAVHAGEVRAVWIRGSCRIPWAEYRRLTEGEPRNDGGTSDPAADPHPIAASPRR